LILPTIKHEKKNYNDCNKRKKYFEKHDSNLIDLKSDFLSQNNNMKKIENLHEEININEVFDNFKNILKLNMNTTKKYQFEIIKENSIQNSSFHKLNDISKLYHQKNVFSSNKSNIMDYSSNKVNKESSEFWSPIDGPRCKTIKKKKYSIDVTKAFSNKNMQINFKKNDSIFNSKVGIINTADKTYSFYDQKSLNNITNNRSGSNLMNSSSKDFNKFFSLKDRIGNLNETSVFYLDK